MGTSTISSIWDLITGHPRSFEYERPVWKARSPYGIAYSWSLLPALAIVYTLTHIYFRIKNLLNKSYGKIYKRNELIYCYSFALGITGLLAIGIGFLSRLASPTGVARLAYSFYFLLLPASILLIAIILSTLTCGKLSTAGNVSRRNPGLIPVPSTVTPCTLA